MVSQKFKKLLQRKSAGPKKKNALIICEGETERRYFDELRKELRLKPSDVTVIYKDSAPISIVDNAIKIVKNKNEPKYDDIFCVFDKDTHPTYKKALDKVNTIKSKNTTIHIINSVPCFEFWLLLHFVFSTKPFTSNEELISDLREHIPDYEKNMANIFAQTKHQLPAAIANAKLTEKECKKTETDNPSTEVHKLVTYLQYLSKSTNEF